MHVRKEERMINREDMLELTRRMTLSRTSITRIAGCYVDRDGDFDGSFNINFLKLSASERTKKLKLAKEIPGKSEKAGTGQNHSLFGNQCKSEGL